MSGAALSSPAPWSDAALVERIARRGRAVVALSGGVDSAVVAALASAGLGEDVVAVTLAGPAVSQREVDRAVAVARELDVGHRVVAVDPLTNGEYRRNPSNRCYVCRSVEAERLLAFGRAWGAVQYLDGVHRDDLHDDRPGIRALDEAGFSHPLVEGGWTKGDVRRAARALGLSNAEQPSDACLASRVAHGQPIERELLARIEAAEGSILDRGFRRVRVRVRGDRARVEVDPDEVTRLASSTVAPEVVADLHRLGFRSVVLDPHGYGRRPSASAGVP
jgi:uncharacterized protein